MQKVEFIIVGQGLAGSILALELIRRNKSVLVIDKPDLSRSSKVAAGIYNPIVFKRLISSWLADTVLPEMFSFFSGVEKEFSQKLMYPTKIARVFASEQEQVLWKKKAVNELSDFISVEIQTPINEYSFLKENFGYVFASGFLDIPLFLKETEKNLESKSAYIQDEFLFDDVVVDKNEIRYKNYKSDKLVFCEGHLAAQNPFFQQIKFKPAKGEVLTIRCDDLQITSCVNKDFFILPLKEKGLYKVGATYNWSNFSDDTTEGAKNYLIQKINSLIPFKYEIVKQEAGVRPSTIDRRPVIGFHQEYKNIGVFNGFGTKAVMLAPYFAKHFCDYIDNKTELFFDVDIKRFSV